VSFGEGKTESDEGGVQGREQGNLDVRNRLDEVRPVGAPMPSWFLAPHTVREN